MVAAYELTSEEVYGAYTQRVADNTNPESNRAHTFPKGFGSIFSARLSRFNIYNAKLTRPRDKCGLSYL